MSSDKRPIVVFDTNMLLLMADGVAVLDHIEEELETKPRCVVIKPVYDEICRIASSSNSVLLRKRALLALKLVNEFCEVVDYKLLNHEDVDSAIVRFALENNAIVASNDRELRKKLRKLGIPEAYFREESKRVKVDGYYK